MESYRADDAESLILIMGSLAETAMTAVDKMREAGKKVGLVRLRLWRPFPLMEFRKAISGAKILAVVDRALSPGAVTPPVASEVRSALYSAPKRPKIFSFIAGLGGRDVTTETFEEIVDKAAFYAKKRPKELYEMIGVREI